MSEYTFIRQSEAEDDLKKYEIFSKKNESISKHLQEIQTENVKAEKSTIEIERMLDSL